MEVGHRIFGYIIKLIIAALLLMILYECVVVFKSKHVDINTRGSETDLGLFNKDKTTYEGDTTIINATDTTGN